MAAQQSESLHQWRAVTTSPTIERLAAQLQRIDFQAENTHCRQDGSCQPSPSPTFEFPRFPSHVSKASIHYLLKMSQSFMNPFIPDTYLNSKKSLS